VQEAERLKEENLRRAGACTGDMEKILMPVDIELYGVSPDERPPSECGKGRDHGGGGGTGDVEFERRDGVAAE